MSHLKQLVKSHKATIKFKQKIKVRKHLNADALFSTVQLGLQEIPDHRPGEVKISLVDTLMSGFAMFSLKDPSLLAFDARRRVSFRQACVTFTAMCFKVGHSLYIRRMTDGSARSFTLPHLGRSPQTT